MVRVGTCLSIIILLICSYSAFALQETGAIQGQIRDLEGQPVPGVTVRAISASLVGGVATTDTEIGGHYRFPSLAPGIYEVRAELHGFQTVTRGEIRLFAANTLTVDFTMQLQTISESIEVSGSPQIDTTSTALVKTVPAEVVRQFPKLQNGVNLISYTPGVGQDLVAYGAAGSVGNLAASNAYMLDGVDISSPRSGASWVYLNPNWIEEVSVAALGVGADYGEFTGVAANFVVRSGGNEFHGLLETFFQNEALVSQNTPDPGPKAPFRTLDSAVQIGGPLIANKLSFFTGLKYSYSSIEPFGYKGVPELQFPGVITKLTFQKNPSNTFQGFVEYDYYHVDQGVDCGPSHLCPGGNATILPEAAFNERTPEASWNGTWISTLTSETVLEARFGGFWGRFNALPRNGEELPGHSDLITGVSSVNAIETSHEWRLRRQVNVSLSHYAQDFLAGNHDFKFGVEFERSATESHDHYNGGFFYYDYDGAPYYRYVWAGYDIQEKNHRTSSYVMDSWHLSAKVNLSLGLRWDHNRGIIKGSGTVFRTDPVAPRIGLIYDVQGNQKTVIKLHYGDYYQAMMGFLYHPTFRFPPTFIECFNGTGWDPCNIRNNRITEIDSGIKHLRVRQFNAGIDRQITSGFTIGGHYIYRKWGNLIEDENTSGQYEQVPIVNPLTGETIFLFNQTNEGTNDFLLRNTPGLFRRYDAVEFYGDRRFANHLYFSASLVISKVRGNTNNELGLTNRFNDPNYNINFSGRLTNDPVFELKFLGLYRFPFGITTSAFFQHHTGDRWTPIARVGGPNQTPSLNQGAVVIFLLPFGTNQLPSQNNLDLRLEKSFHFYRGELLFTMDVFNVFNSAYITGVQTRFDQEGFGTPQAYNDPRRIQIGVRYTF